MNLFDKRPSLADQLASGVAGVACSQYASQQQNLAAQGIAQQLSAQHCAAMRAESKEEMQDRMLREAPMAVNSCRPPTPAWVDLALRVAYARIAKELAGGNPLFANIETWEQYVHARDLQDKINKQKERLEKGFWRYYFGA